MKNRFSKMGKTLLGAVCLLSISGVTYSCSDDYDLDETMPSFLGGSIYDELKARKFTTVVRLIEDLGYKEVLAKTGSKTLFVADDVAYESFFKNNTSWLAADGSPVKSYDQLSISQKRWLLNGAMLNSAYVLEMLAHHGSEKNVCLRQMSAATAIDSIRYWKWNELPENLNEGELDDKGNLTGDKKFWEPYRKESVGGIYMALDKTSPMLTHFLEGQLKEKKITRDDIAFILNDKNGWTDEDENRSYVYGSKIKEQDVTCLNGYFHVLDSVLVTPQNMAEMIRTNGRTNLFSSLLERFSAPYYDYDLTVQYKALHDIDADSVFQKRYISARSIGNAKIEQGPDKKGLGVFPYLPYDPGCNELASGESVGKEKDMAAMFVPNDEAMVDYFINGGGKVLMERYAKKPNTPENLQYNLFQIPLDIIQALISNLMKDSFAETVPSKYLTITNDAQDQMFPASKPDYNTLDSYKACFEKCLLANNGVVYIMNRVMSPADYASVIAPALFNKNTQVVKTVARADDNFIDGKDFNKAPLQKYYSTYLKAMQSRFSFFVPTDEGLGTYGIVDPMSIAMGKAQKSKWRYWRFFYDNAIGSKFAIRSQAYKYNMETGQNPSTDSKLSGGKNNSASTSDLADGTAGEIKKSLLIDMMDQHILVHENDDKEGLNAPRQFFTSRGGAPVYIVSKGDATKDGKGMIVDGGFQYQLNRDSWTENDHDCIVTEGYNMTSEKNGDGNGMTYLLDRPMQPTTRSFHEVLRSDESHYSEFRKLCEIEFSDKDLELIGFRKPNQKDSEWESEQNKYRILTDVKGFNPATGEKLVRFFNNYRYTIYVPTNEAVLDAFAHGLPNAETIKTYIETHKTLVPGETDDNGEPVYIMEPEFQETAQAMVTMVINFVKYHFQDQAFYVDHAESDGSYQTSCVDVDNNVYLTIDMKQTDQKITVTDKAGVSQDVIEPFNVIARDANYDNEVKKVAYSIENSSYVVLHQVKKPLVFIENFYKNGTDENGKPYPNGSYQAVIDTHSKAKAFLAKYRILK